MMGYVSPPGDKNTTGTEIEEDSKDELMQSTANNEELFKHLSYLSQLNNDVQKHQQIE
jgi:hypothetical protein